MSKSELFDNLDNLEEIWIIWTWNKWLANMPFRYCSVFLKNSPIRGWGGLSKMFKKSPKCP